MKIVRGHHVSFSVTDLDRSRHFYGSVLGLAEIPRPAMRGAGLEVVEAGRERGQLWVGDPDGNVIELIVPMGR